MKKPKPTTPERPSAKSKQWEHLPTEWKDEFEERAGIYEFEAHHSREVAERLAFEWVMRRMNGSQK